MFRIKIQGYTFFMSLFCSSKTFAENKNCRIYKENILIGCHVRAEHKNNKKERETQSQAQNSEIVSFSI